MPGLAKLFNDVAVHTVFKSCFFFRRHLSIRVRRQTQNSGIDRWVGYRVDRGYQVLPRGVDKSSLHQFSQFLITDIKLGEASWPS